MDIQLWSFKIQSKYKQFSEFTKHLIEKEDFNIEYSKCQNFT